MLNSRSRTPNTPFIPPLSSPEGSPAPVIPPQSSTTPNYSPNPNPAYLYPTSPYANSPFIPPTLSPVGTPGVIPGGLPTSQPRGPRPGLSEDYTGYPSPADLQQPPPHMTPMSAGYGPIPLSSPWHPPSSAPAAYAGFNATPWNAPPAPLPQAWPGPYARGPPPQQYSPYFTPAGFGPGPLPGGQPQWGMPPPGVAASVPHPGAQPGYYGGPPEWMQHQQAAAAMQHGHGFGHVPQHRRGPEPQAAATDRMPPFTKGPHYGPVLEPMEAFILEAAIKINPLLLPLPDDGSEQVHLKWNMLFPTSTIQRSTEPSSKSWSEGRDDPATFPRVMGLNIISETIPWIITIHTRNPAGVTCGEVIEGIAHTLGKFTTAAEYKGLSQQARHEVMAAYRHNRSRAADVPGGKLGEGMKKIDFLGRRTMFGGIEVNDQLVRKLHLNTLPCTFVLKCSTSLPMTQREVSEREARMNSHGRTRSRANSTNITVEPPSSTDDSDDLADNDYDHYR